ncbi:hypothetical protein FRC17_003983 [Serendipita sp. 399]|nr:hypothetical protein FRC17_003983 [Serendipita sp. 399]
MSEADLVRLTDYDPYIPGEEEAGFYASCNGDSMGTATTATTSTAATTKTPSNGRDSIDSFNELVKARVAAFEASNPGPLYPLDEYGKTCFMRGCDEWHVEIPNHHGKKGGETAIAHCSCDREFNANHRHVSNRGGKVDLLSQTRSQSISTTDSPQRRRLSALFWSENANRSVAGEDGERSRDGIPGNRPDGELTVSRDRLISSYLLSIEGGKSGVVMDPASAVSPAHSEESYLTSYESFEIQIRPTRMNAAGQGDQENRTGLDDGQKGEDEVVMADNSLLG